ncbi:MAG: ribonuclease HI family protein [Patescibacteria group bacterium]
MKNSKIKIFTDGGSRGNPGPAAVGVVFKDLQDKTINEFSDFIGETTNGQAEYQAIILGLKKAKSLKYKIVELFADSQFIIEQLNGNYKIKEAGIVPLFIQAWNLHLDFDEIKFIFIPREQNQEADKLVNIVLNSRQRVKKIPGL